MKKIVRILAITGAVLTLIINIFQYDHTKYNADPYETRLIKQTDLFSNHSNATKGEKRVSIYLGKAEAGTPVEVLESYFEWIKVQLPDGTMGWTSEMNIPLPPQALSRHTKNPLCGIYDQPDTRKGKQLKRLKKRTLLTVLEHYEDTSIRGYTYGFTKVRAKDGTEGWMKDYHIERVGWKQPRRIKRHVRRYEKKPFLKKWTGKSIEKFVKKFAEPSGIKLEEGKKIYYFNNIFLYDGDRVEIGMQVTVADDKIEAINRSHRITKWIGKFPLSSTLRSPLLMNIFWNIFSYGESKSYNKFGDTTGESGFKQHGVFSWIIAIIAAAAFLSMFYVIVAFPYTMMHKVAWRYSQDTSHSNNAVLTVVWVGAVVFGYLFFVFLNVNLQAFNNYFLLHFLFSLGMTTGFINKWRSDLMYHRCRKCRYWSGTHDRSELLGVTESTRTTTYSDGRRSKDKGTTEHWRDFQYCNRPECGYRWYIDRTWWSGWSRS